MVEYKVIRVINIETSEEALSLEDELNALADDDWVVVCSMGGALILERNAQEIVSYYAEKEAEKRMKEILDHQFTFSHSIDGPNSG